MEEEFAYVFRLPLQHLLDQVVHDVAVVTGKAADELRDIVSPLHRERGQLECGDPAFGPRFQNGELACRQVQGHGVIQVSRSLVRREPQIGGADLDELAASAQPSQREWWVGAASNY